MTYNEPIKYGQWISYLLLRISYISQNKLFILPPHCELLHYARIKSYRFKVWYFTLKYLSQCHHVCVNQELTTRPPQLLNWLCDWCSVPYFFYRIMMPLMKQWKLTSWPTSCKTHKSWKSYGLYEWNSWCYFYSQVS